MLVAYVRTYVRASALVAWKIGMCVHCRAVWIGVEWRGVEWSGVEWSGVEWSRVGFALGWGLGVARAVSASIRA